ncbi:MAG: tripartite tricarboxylate transporter substrate binding protein [Deltaproteobacteria bacterium]|nr:tripartite tricarboxylate transporter substrate binding protein [Deltaproteobacteria bacterium]
MLLWGKIRKALAFMGLLSVCICGVAGAEYPDRTIQLIIGFDAGGSEDLRARALVSKLGEVLGQPVVVMNKPGASGSVALSLLAKAKPDGYTLGSASASPVLFVPHVQKVEYNPLTDFTYICGSAVQPLGIVVKSDAPWNTFNELVEYVEKNPGKLKYGTFGIGGGAHVYMELVGKSRNLNWVHVPFKGDQPTVNALLGGHIPVAVSPSTFVPHVRGGKLKLLAMATESRSSAFPQVPTLKELGFNLDFRAFGDVLGYLGPKGLPPGIVKKLEDAFKKAVESPDFQQIMENLTNDKRYRDSREFTKMIHEVYPRTGQMIAQLGISQTTK